MQITAQRPHAEQVIKGGAAQAGVFYRHWYLYPSMGISVVLGGIERIQIHGPVTLPRFGVLRKPGKPGSAMRPFLVRASRSFHQSRLSRNF